MPTVLELETLPRFLAFLVWCFVVWAIAQAVFRSWPAQALLARLWSNPEKSRRLRMLNWELRNRLEYDEDLARGNQLVQGRPLALDELQARERELLALSKRTVGIRLVTYLLQCAFCQHFWIAAVLAPCLCVWGSFGAELLPTIFAYTGVTTVLLGWITSTIGEPQRAPAAGGCSGAGHGRPGGAGQRPTGPGG